MTIGGAYVVLQRRAAFTHAERRVEQLNVRVAITALAELTPDGVLARFDPEATVPGAWCASFAGRAGKGAEAPVHPALIVPNQILHGLAGVNDGIVPTASMGWGERLGTLEADHGRQIGVHVTPSSLYDSKAFFADVCDRLRERGL